MRLHHLRIQNYRGIRELDWTVPANSLCCLIGPGDSCKSTILDAIELLLYPRYNPSLDDTDFFKCDPSLSLAIEGTFAGLPEEFLREQRLGLCLRGVGSDGTIHDEPEKGDEEAVTIRVQVGPSLEPTWAVVSDRQPSGTPFSSADRQNFGCSRLGAAVDWQLAWTRNSLLARITGDLGEHARVLADASRQARKTVSTDSLTELKTAAATATTLAADLGVAPSVEFRPGLDAKEASLRQGAISLHDGEVPARRAGQGTRRLLAMALQRSLNGQGGSIMLVDEVEHALEPYRVRRLVRALKAPPPVLPDKSKLARKTPICRGLTVLTTHSETVLTELTSSDLVVVRRHKNGSVMLKPVGSSLQSLIRKAPEAFLARRVVVCEGKTEVGLCRGLDVVESEGTGCFAYYGTAFADAGGRTCVGTTAVAFIDLGYEVCVLADSDADLDIPDADLTSKGIKVVRWNDKVSTEQRLALDLPWDLLVKMLDLAIEHEGLDSIIGQIQHHLGVDPGKTEPEWQIHDQSKFRQAIGDAACGKKKGKDDKKGSGWFKRIDLGEEVGVLVARNLDSIKTTDAGKKIGQLLEWVRAGV
jgi:putative ATP-dependent endonuclease of the OLD family